jgi:hypothetical protein
MTAGQAIQLPLATLAILVTLALDATPAAAWTKGQIARHQNYLACKTRIQKDPPCNQNWTRYCARQCHALFW